MGYFDFQKKSDCIVCIDSDGCAMDTMEVKHRTCFGPQWIKTFGLTEYEAECMELWLSINLYSITRGINRFKGLALALAEVEKRGLGNIEGLAEYEAWTKEAKELSNPALLAVTQKSDNPCFEKALLWSIRTNRAIHALPAEDRPFPNVKSAMDAMAKQADLAAGTKAFCIGELRKMGYEPGRILMVGDAPGDRDAAEKNGVRFYPILVGHEGESWKRLLEKAFPKLLAGSFDAKYQKELNQAFEQNLGVHADSE